MTPPGNSVREILTRLVSFDSVSSRSNLGIIRWIGDYLAELGVPVEIVAAPDGQPKANLWASIGPDRDGGIVLSGHTDVVPVEASPGRAILSRSGTAATAGSAAALRT